MKKIGTAIYTHCSNCESLSKKHEKLIDRAIAIMIDADMYNQWLGCVIYKIDTKKNTVSFIESKNFDTAREPDVGDAYTVNLNTEKIKITKAKGQIYHHKWMFVTDDYAWFDVEESKRWSKTWQKVLPNDRIVKSRIGYKKYWDEYLRKYGLIMENKDK